MEESHDITILRYGKVKSTLHTHGLNRQPCKRVYCSVSHTSASSVQLRDVSIDSHTSPTKAFIKVCQSDPFRQSVTITLGKTDQQLRPLIALLQC